MAGRCAVSLLGGFRVVVDGDSVSAGSWRHRRGADLVKLLSLADGHRLHREQLTDVLWPDLEPAAAAANLRKATHYARRALGAEAAVVADGPLLELWPGGELSVDVDAFEEAARVALSSGDAAACAKASEMYPGELLPEDRFEPWAHEPRERLRLRALELLKAGRCWDRVLDVDPADEEAHRALMQQHMDSGDRRAAMRVFERLREVLRADLGVGPDAATVALYEEILAMEGREPPSPAERARALLAWGLVHWNRRDFDEAERIVTEARALALSAELPRELGEASALLGMTAQARGRWQDLFRSEFVSSVRRDPALVSFVFDAHLCLAEFSLFSVEGHEKAGAFAAELLAVADEAGSARGQALATLMLGEVELFSGRLDEAEETLERAAHLHEAAEARSGLVLTLERQAEAALERGRRWRAGRLLSRALRIGEEDALAPHLVVRAYGTMVQAATGQEVAEIMNEAEAVLRRSDVCEPCSMGYHVAVVTRSALTGDGERARRHLDRAERVAGMWQGGPWAAAVWEARAALRHAEGETTQASALYREAASLFAQYGRPLDEARCRAAAAE